MIPNEMPMLSGGGHQTAEYGTCVMEYISMVMGYEFTMLPECTDNMVAGFAWNANDWMSHVGRQRLLALVPRLSSAAQLVPNYPKDKDFTSPYQYREAYRAWQRDFHEARAERGARLTAAWNSAFPADAIGYGERQPKDTDWCFDEFAPLDSEEFMPGRLLLDRMDPRNDDVYYRALEAVLDEHERIAAEWGIETACPVEIPQVILDLVEAGR